MNKDKISKTFGTYAVKLDFVGSHKMQGLKLSAEWKVCNFLNSSRLINPVRGLNVIDGLLAVKHNGRGNAFIRM
jgi:hypothetical protein